MKNIMVQLSYCILITFIFTLALTSYTYADTPKLYNFTCDQYWGYHKTHSKEADEKKYFQEMADLWNYSVNNFKREHPTLEHPSLYTVPNVEEWKDPPFFIMGIYMACSNTDGNGSKILGKNLENNFLKLATEKAREDNAIKNGCTISNGTQARLFFYQAEGSLNACIEKPAHNAPHIKILYNEKKKAAALEVCIKKEAEEFCQTVQPAWENICLSTYGECAQIAESGCGWIHTDASKKCLDDSKTPMK